MWVKEFKIKTNASAEKIWEVYKDVKNWKKWDDGIEYSFLDGEFLLGGTGVLKPVGGPKTKFKIIELVENEKFIDITKLPFCTLKFTHRILKEGKQNIIHHQVEFRGFLSFLFSKIIGSDIEKNMENLLKKFVEIAEK